MAVGSAVRQLWWPNYRNKHVLNIPQKYLTMKGLPDQTGMFSPFFTDGDTKEPWPRDNDWNRFESAMAANKQAHTLLAGPSGSGKSTFLERIVKARIPEAQIVSSNSYFKFISTILHQLPHHPKEEELSGLEDEVDAFLKSVPADLSIDRAFQEAYQLPKPNAPLAVMGNRVTKYVEETLAGKPLTYFVFDQIERFLSQLKHLQSQPRHASEAASLFIVIQVLKTLRRLDNTRTIFSIRADALFDTIDFLAYSLDDVKDADTKFQYFYFNGINLTTSPKAVNQIGDNYKGLPVDWVRFKAFTSLNTKTMSNTFLTQLSGYMLENFHETDTRVVEIMRDETKSPSDLLPIFFEHLIAGFHQSPDGLISHDIFKAVVLTIALENHCGEAITQERISRLSHIPESYVEPVVKYLLGRNVLKPDRHLGKDWVRFSHDLLFNHIVEAPEFQGRDDLHKGVERLVEYRIPTDDLINVRSYGDFWKELRRWKLPALSMVLYWAFALVLVISSTLQLLPANSATPWLNATCNSLFKGYNWAIHLAPSLDRLLSVTGCAPLGHYAAAIAVMHSVWLWYIYKLDRGYLRYVFSDSPWCRRFSAALVPAGSLLGICVGFAPNLCVVPITFIGLLMAILLLFAARQNGWTSPFGQANRDWGTRTIVNMILTTVLMVNLHSFMLSPLYAYVDAREAMESEWIFRILHLSPEDAVFWGTAIFLIWFWWHIRPVHQSAISMAARLTQFDVGRNLRLSQIDVTQSE